MKKNTLQEYKKVIKAQYEVARQGTYSSFLEEPSPAQIRDLCLLLFDTGLSKNDENVFREFFKATGNDDLRKTVSKVDTAKFRPIISFLKGSTDTNDLIKINIAAILVGYEIRPYQKFLNKEITITGREEVKRFPKYDDVEVVVSQKSKRKIKPPIVAVVVIALVVLSGFGIRKIFFEEKCMVWKGDHYEAVACDDQPQGIAGMPTGVIPKDETLLKTMHKIKATANTKFFENGQPLIWYSKDHGKCEFFTAPGLNPETGRTLRPITLTIINKHILK